MQRVDVRAELKHLYRPSPDKPVFVDVPEMNFLMVDGKGDPNTAQDYKDAVEALFAIAYAIKFMVKKGEAAIDYSVLPLEGLWWADDMSLFMTGNKDEWKWAAMIMQPKYVTIDLFKKAVEQVGKRKELTALAKVRFEGFNEGTSVQIMYLGPYPNEGPTIEALHAFAIDNGYSLRGKHHEIYLGDPGRTAPKKLRTIIRQPIEKT